MDAYRRGNEYKVLLDLPGTDPGSIELTVEKDLFTVRAKRTWIQAEDDQIQIADGAKVTSAASCSSGRALIVRRSRLRTTMACLPSLFP